jgi:DNA-binding PadR family transcriptional regulator
MPLTPLERDFLERLAIEPWDSPPLFDHALVARLVENGCIDTEVLSTGAIRYEITDAGRDALAEPQTGL